MKEQIDAVFYDLKNELITEKQAHERVLQIVEDWRQEHDNKLLKLFGITHSQG